MEASEESPEHTDDYEVSEEDNLHRSTRQRKCTERMQMYQEEEAHRKEKRLHHLYEQWKKQVCITREQLKENISNSHIGQLLDNLEHERDNVIKLYIEIRDHISPSMDTRRLIDACEAVTADMIKVAHERLSGVDDYDTDKVKVRLRELLKKDYAHSVYGSSVTFSDQHSSVSKSHSSAKSVVAARRAEAAAELAAKEAEYEVVREEEKQREKIDLLNRELERLKVEKEVKAARARLKTYDEEMKRENSVYSADVSRSVQQIPISSPTPMLNSNVVIPSPPQADVFYLAQAVQDSIAMNRLPMPEPSIFTGDPIQFIEWKAAFTALIDKKNISPADKLHYLKKYVRGPA